MSKRVREKGKNDDDDLFGGSSKQENGLGNKKCSLLKTHSSNLKEQERL